MKKLFTLSAILLAFSAVGQAPVLQVFEADSAAEPRGGMAYLTTFLQANLRKPIAAEAQGVGGRVVVTGIVESDGRISDVKVVNAFRPDCDREAVRVFRLFNAWKPGYKDGKPIRQQVNIPILFKPNTPFVYVNGVRIDYFDADKAFIADSSKARFRQISPLDSSGIPNGDIVLYKGKINSWKEELRLPLMRKENGWMGLAGKRMYLVGYQDGINRLNGRLVSVDDEGNIVRETYYKDGKLIGTELSYYPNGSIHEKTEEYAEKYVTTSWYTNGQIRQIQARDKQKPGLTMSPEHVLAYWDNTGRQQVKDGAGWVVYESLIASPAIPGKKIRFLEEGLYENGFKQGLWKGRHEDGLYAYEEEYNKGVSQSGKSILADGTVLRYTEFEKQPEFKGGMAALGQFLSNNLRYPADAQRARAQGQVYITFTVEKDGSVTEANVLKGMGYGADEEALRVVKATNGRWSPGMQRGVPVRVKYNLPINFTLQ